MHFRLNLLIQGNWMYCSSEEECQLLGDSMVHLSNLWILAYCWLKHWLFLTVVSWWVEAQSLLAGPHFSSHTSRLLPSTSASLLQPLPASLWHTPRKHRCVWAYPDGGVVAAEGRQPTSRLHTGHPPAMQNLFLTAKMRTLIGSVSTNVWAGKQLFTG